MSERGSFTTEYIYDKELFEICKEEFKDWPWPYSILTDNVICGRIKGHYSGEEINYMECEVIPNIQKKMNDNMELRICVLSDCGGECLFYVNKNIIKFIHSKEGKVIGVWEY